MLTVSLQDNEWLLEFAKQTAYANQNMAGNSYKKQFTELKKQSHECIIYQTCQVMYLSIINVNVTNWFHQIIQNQYC
jgi:phage anti-repressor protein